MPLPSIEQTHERVSAKELVFNALKDWIITGTLKPGEKLLVAEIATLFNVSRTPVREAILALHNLELVEVYPGKTTVVSHLNLNNIKNLYNSLAVIHIGVLSLSFDRVDEEFIKTIENLNENLKKCNSECSPTQIKELDDAFHEQFFILADNPYLKNYHDQLTIYTKRVENLFFKEHPHIEKTYMEHLEIINALKDRDINKASHAMKNNWQFYLETFINDEYKQ